jgi:hypothetical protein
MDFEKLESASIDDLFKLFNCVLDELRRRKIIRSKNNPVADYAELLAVKALDLRRENKSTTGFDATDVDGLRYEIKGRRLTDENESRQLSFIRGLDEKAQPFDYLVRILFKQDFTVFRACRVPVRTVHELAVHRKRENAWRFLLVDAVWARPDVKDITDPIRQAAVGLSRRAGATS